MTSELLRAVTVRTSKIDRVPAVGESCFTPLEELIRRMGHPPLTFAEWAAKAPDVFESEEEVDEMIAFTYAERQRFAG